VVFEKDVGVLTLLIRNHFSSSVKFRLGVICRYISKL
jgi:hypothetical protein